MKNYATVLTVNDFDIRVKGGKLHLNDLLTAGESTNKLLERFGGALLGEYVSQSIALKYADYISTSFSESLSYAVCLYNSSQCLRNMVLYAQTSMWEAVRAAGGLGIGYANEYDLISEIVLGCTSFEFVEDNGLPEDCCYLEYMTDVQLAALYCLLRLNAVLIKEGVCFSQRREKFREKFYSI